jgi:hypothetical protein
LLASLTSTVIKTSSNSSRINNKAQSIAA